MTKKSLIIGAIAATAGLAGGWALAQSVAQGPGGFGPPFMHGQGPGGMGPGMMQGMGHGMGPGMMMGMHQGMGPGMHGGAGLGFADPAQLERLKTELGIAPAQEEAWNKYAKAVQGAAAAMKAMREGVDPQAVSKMTPADRFAFVSKMREQAQQKFGAVEAAATALLTALDESQKARARELLPGLAFGPSTMRGADLGQPPYRR